MAVCRYARDATTMNFDEARARRRELLEIIGHAADEIARIDADLPVLQSQALESDLNQAEPRPLDCL